MNNIAKVALVGGSIGVAKGFIDEKQSGQGNGSDYLKRGLSEGLKFASISAAGFGVYSFIKDPKEIAKEISGSKITESKLYKDVFPGKEAFLDEVAEKLRQNDTTIVNKETIKVKLDDKIDLFGNGSTVLPIKTVSQESVNAMTNFRNSNFTDADFDELFNKISNADDKNVAENISNIFRNVIDENTTKAEDITSETVKNMEAFKKVPLYTKTYYSNKDLRNTRIMATIGAASAVSVGGRYLSGGTLTRDQYGQKDLAGIPFI